MIRAVVQREAIDVASEIAGIERDGAVATFSGMVRADGGVTSLELEHYPGATERALAALCTEALARWSLSAATIVHRVGAMAPGERIVFVGTAAAHRAAALDACGFLIDRLKTDAPFWKCETRGETSRWIEARDADDTAAERWRRSG